MQSLILVVKNPLSPVEHPGGVGVNNELFEESLEQFVVCGISFTNQLSPSLCVDLFSDLLADSSSGMIKRLSVKTVMSPEDLSGTYSLEAIQSP